MTARDSDLCPAHVVVDGEPLDCLEAPGHLMPHEAVRADGELFEWDSFGSGQVSS
jgi:hypothetical protein